MVEMLDQKFMFLGSPEHVFCSPGLGEIIMEGKDEIRSTLIDHLLIAEWSRDFSMIFPTRPEFEIGDLVNLCDMSGTGIRTSGAAFNNYRGLIPEEHPLDHLKVGPISITTDQDAFVLIKNHRTV
jgi:hypothetical protein